MNSLTTINKTTSDVQAATATRSLWDYIMDDRTKLLSTVITLIGMVVGLVAGWQQYELVANSAYFVAYVAGGFFGLINVVNALKKRTIDIDMLMILAALGAAFVGALFEGVMLLFLFSLSNRLQEFAFGRTRKAIQALIKLRPTEALVKEGNTLTLVPIEAVKLNDLIVVKPGERLPMDGKIASGWSNVDQSTITGESMPVGKKVDDDVFAGTMNINGSLEIRITKLAKDSTLARLIELVEKAQSEKSETQRFIDTAEQYYAVGVILLTIVVALFPVFFLQEAFYPAFYRAMTVMVAASPCAIVISTPATVLSAIGSGARQGVLFKGGAHLEDMVKIKVIAFDKTGTLTIGEPQVTDIVPWTNEISESGLLALAAAVELKSEHPLAQTTVKAARERELTWPEVVDFEAIMGQGVKAKVDGRQIYIGNLRLFSQFDMGDLTPVESELNNLRHQGKTSVIVGEVDQRGVGQVLGLLAYADVIRPDAEHLMRSLKSRGIEHLVMLTGDNEIVARQIAKMVGLDDVMADLMPEDKVAAIKKVQAKYGPVAMIGDGVNDAPALATADVGIAMGAAGSDVALETADIVLMSDDLQNLSYIIDLSHKTQRVMRQNLGFALLMILIMLGAIFISDLALPFAVLGHEGGTVLVALNGLRLLGFKREQFNNV
ncbi:MAG: Cd2+/Zn2+-exporting ATPase [Cellvibrionaceae bacterium]|jgi:Cd2+/Zn2+-exporting ATPase